MSLRSTVYSFFSVINKIIKKKNTIVIYGGNALDDNSEAMFRYLLSRTQYPIVCLVDNSMSYKLRSNCKMKRCTYINALYYLFNCKVMIDSSYHTIKMRPTKNQLFIQCWHGSPLKMMKPAQGISNSDYYSVLFYSAEIFKSHMKKFFCAQNNKMYLAGNPRNDYLFERISLPAELDHSGKKVIWMPTFRHGLGKVESDSDIPVLTKDNISELNDILRSRNIKLYIKAHRLQARSFEDILGKIKSSNIVLISDEQLRKYNIPLYRFVGDMDALLTDYSSIYFDYLLLDRPIGFVIDDFEQYMKNRGFAFENPLDYMPGEKIYDFKGLIGFFEHLSAGADEFRSERKKANELCNYYRDNKNCQRCAELIKKVISE